MLKKLRIRFVCVLMAIVTLTMTAIFGLMFQFTKANWEAACLSMMESVAEDPLRLGTPASRTQAVNLPYFLIKVSARGELITVSGGEYDLTDRAFLDTLIRRALEDDREFGVIPEYSLRYLLVRNRSAQTLVFADIRSEKAAMRAFVRSGCIMGTVCLGIFLAVSVLLARWMVGPVEKAWKQQRQFVSDASHELKTPLTVILTNAELLQTPDPDTQKKCAGSILTMAGQMRALVEDLLELARSDNEQSKMVFEPVDLSTLVSDGLLPFDAVFFEAGLMLDSRVEPGIALTGSRQHLNQLLDILLDNARKYAEGGTVTVNLASWGKHHCRLTVSNESQPLTEGECRDIFRRFYRKDQARSRDGSFGLGLSIAETIVSAHKGKIWAEWKDGRVTFTAELPRRSAGAEGTR